MDLKTQLLFFFSALGAFNGIIVGIFFLFYAKPKHRSHLFLGLLLLALSIRVGKSVFYYFSYDLADVYIQIGLFACWFIGPLLYFYTKSALEINRTIKKEVKVHFSILMLIALTLFIGFPRAQYEDLWFSVFIQSIYTQWIIYVAISGYLIWKHYTKLRTVKNSIPSFKFWFLSIYIGNTIICIAFNTAHYTSYIVGALSFSFVFYLLILLLLFAKKRNELLFLNPPKYLDKSINTKEAQLWINKLENLMKEEQVFKDTNITLPKIAKKLAISPNRLSMLLNDTMKISFSNYLNKKRIEEAQKIIKNNPNYSLETISFDCGFNSKSAFYAAFKKHTGKTPSKYRDLTNS
ncbi:helix-turn-helix domain-containing protein [Aquimarina mytili]